MVHVTNRRCWYQHVEVLKGLKLLVSVSEALIALHHVAEVVVGVLSLLLHELHGKVEHLNSLSDFSTDGQIFSKSLELELLEEAWNKLQEVLIVLQTCVLDHPDIA